LRIEAHGSSVVTLLLASGLLAVVTWNVIATQGNLGWDDADYLRNGLKTANVIRATWLTNPSRALGSLMRVRPKPPMLVGWISLGGLIPPLREPIRLILFSSVVPFAFLLVAVFATTRDLSGVRSTWAAILAVGASPMALSFGSKVMVETFMATWVLLTYFFAAKLLDRPCGTRSMALGTAIGLVMMTKMTAPMFLAAPALWYIYRFVGRHGGKAASRRLPWILIPIVLISGPWYAANLGKAIRFATFSAQYNVVALAESDGISRISRPLALVQALLGWPLVAAVILAGIMPRNRRGGGVQRTDSANTFMILSGLGTVSGVVFLLFPPYFDPRFLLPIWPSLAIVLGPSLRDAIRDRDRVLAVATVTLLSVAMIDSTTRLAREQHNTTYWKLSSLIEHLVKDYHVKNIYNVGDCPDWNVSKTGFLNELRPHPEDCFVLHDLSKAGLAEYNQRIPDADAVVALDRGRIPTSWFAYGPELNKGCDQIVDHLEHDERFFRIHHFNHADVPPLLVFVRAR